jgi:predicted CopG family antitoxin
MPFKTITITLKAYETLLKLKRPRESFSDVILRLARGVPDILELAGAWSDVTQEEAEGILKSIREAWASWKPQRER